MNRERKRFRKGFRNKDEDQNCGDTSRSLKQKRIGYRDRHQDRNLTKHPSHLKGKEIGLYYARKSRERRRSEREERDQSTIGRPLATIMLSGSRKAEISELLDTIKVFNKSYLSKEMETVQDSDFKTEFLKLIAGTFEQKLSKYVPKKPVACSEHLSDTYFHKFLTTSNSNIQFREMAIKRQKLPCFNKKNEIIQLIKNNQIVVVCGETGCGKTTQITQYILDDYILSKNGSKCKIICTQPRRISAISVAERVAEERGEKCGASTVGYQIRLEKKLPRDSGSITYCTTGILLKLMESNPSLIGYSHLVLDEIHERDITSDIVIALMKIVTVKRPDLKLILMSATLNAEQFSKYYNNCAIINIPGFTHPVEVFYLEDALARTKYNFAPCKLIKGWRKHLTQQKPKNQEIEDFTEIMTPYVKNLQSKKKYSSKVCTNLLNPNSEQIDPKFIVELVKYICNKSDDDGSILVFVPGIFDIYRITTCLNESKCFPPNKYIIINLHSKLPSIEQRRVFVKPPRGFRKIVISTNIAETSITIDDVIYVIDSGKIKMKSYNVEEDLEALKDEWVTKANADQRKGRAGRVQPGICYHLISRPRLFGLQLYPTPEIQRSRVEGLILTIKLLQLGKAGEFLGKLMDPPDPKAVENGIKLLKQMNALDSYEYITPLGYHLAKLPVHPRMGKMILLGALFSCLEPILSIAASLDFKDAFYYPIDKHRIVNERKKNLLSGWNSDHLILAEALRLYEVTKATGRENDFCKDYFLSRHTLELLYKMKEQFAEYLFDMKFITNKGVKSQEWNQNSKNYSLIKAIVCAGLYPNVAVIRKVNKNGRKIVRTTECEKVVISNNSVNNSEKIFTSPLLVYHVKQKLAFAINLFDTTMVHPLPLLFFGDQINIETIKNERNEKETIISLSNILRFKCKEDTARLIKELRGKLDNLLAYKITHPGCVSWLEELHNPEVKVMRAIMELITSEDLGELDMETDDEISD